MTIEIKISKKPIEYNKAIKYLERRLDQVVNKKSKELLWILEHPSIYTAGKTYKNSEILNKKIKIISTNRGGKITWHGPGQLICYFVIDLKKRNKDIRIFIKSLENVIITTLNKFNIKSFADRKNVGIWVEKNQHIYKVAAIGLRVKKWIAYHGFSLNISNKIEPYEKIIPCGIKNRGVTNLYKIKKQDYKSLRQKIINSFIFNMEI
tara:strand:+ start:1505 stop:2125 length:621 start_codon:yes stop_codon:yes gene_type:complete